MTLIHRKLEVLRARAEGERYAEHPILTRSRLVWALLGFRGQPKFADLSLFVFGILTLLVGFGILSGLSSGMSSAKRILGETAVGFEFLQDRDLEAARLQFIQTEAEIRRSNFYVVADRISEISQHLLAAFEILNTDEGGFFGFDFGWDQTANASSELFYDELKASHDLFRRAAFELSEAQSLVSDLPTNLLPRELQGEVERGLKLLGSAQMSLDTATQVSGVVLALLEGEPKTYMLIFQNNNEARATGGFIGTYGLAEFGHGRMKINKIESIYEPDGQLKERIAAPGALRRQVTELWAMRDSNWFADFPSSSRKILEFLEKETGVLADGVISFTPDVFENLLAFTGPVEMPEYDTRLTADNFREITQQKTSIDYDKTLNQPKKFLADFAPRLLARLGTGEENMRLKLFEALGAAVAEKHLMMFSLDEDIENSILKFGAGGELKQTSGDYLAIIHSNIGGGKTDMGMQQSVKKTVTIDDLGRQISTLRITRTNNATNELYFPENIDFMRVFVPEGSKILEANGFDSAELLPSSSPGLSTDADLQVWDSQITRDFRTGIYVGRESSRTVFMGFLALKPGESKTIELVYTLPQLGPDYSLLVQKQSGGREFEFDLDVFLTGREVVYQYPKSLEPETLKEDHFYAVIGR